MPSQGFGALAKLGKRKRDREGAGADADGAREAAEIDAELEALEEARALLSSRAAGSGSGSGSGSSSSSSSSAQQHVNNVPGLRAALAEARADLPWVQRLEVVSAERLESSLPSGVGDDLKVELAFYGQALAAVSAARGELERLGVPHRRPDDYVSRPRRAKLQRRRHSGGGNGNGDGDARCRKRELPRRRQRRRCRRAPRRRPLTEPLLFLPLLASL